MENTFPDFAEWAATEHDWYGLAATAEDVRPMLSMPIGLLFTRIWRRLERSVQR